MRLDGTAIRFPRQSLQVALLTTKRSSSATNMNTFAKTKRTTLKRLPKRAQYDREAVHRILDEGFICHVGFMVEGQPFVIPTGYARVGDTLFIHGSQASRMLRAVGEGVDICLTVTLVDGLVLARSGSSRCNTLYCSTASLLFPKSR